jgi:putative membrane protein
MPPIFPTVNASLNFCAGVFLLLGWLAIKRGDKKLHQRLMVGALISSALFLISYISYHIVIHGVTKYQKTDFTRPIYFFILGTHTPLAAAIVPFCIAAVYHAYKGNFAKHTRITKWLMPVWMYVSVTGVLVYVMLYIL